MVPDCLHRTGITLRQFVVRLFSCYMNISTVQEHLWAVCRYSAVACLFLSAGYRPVWLVCIQLLPVVSTLQEHRPMWLVCIQLLPGYSSVQDHRPMWLVRWYSAVACCFHIARTQAYVVSLYSAVACYSHSAGAQTFVVHSQVFSCYLAISTVRNICGQFVVIWLFKIVVLLKPKSHNS